MIADSQDNAMLADDKKRQLLVVASTFPRWQRDSDPPFVFDLCRRLKDRYDIRVLAPHAAGTKKRERLGGISIERFRYCFERAETLAYAGGILNRLQQNHARYGLIPFFLLGELAATVRLLSRYGFDVINAHWLIPQGLVAVWAKKILRSSIPLVCTLHGGDVFALNGPVLTRLKRFVLAQCDAITVVSNAMREKIISIGATPSLIHVIPMGVDLVRSFVPVQNNRKPKSLLFVGRFVEKKGLRYLIEALPRVLHKHPDAHLTVVGSGPEEDRIRKRVSKLDLDRCVTFTGAVSNMLLPGLYQSADIVVFPSIRDTRGDMEGFGLVLVEALGCECCVISTDLPAVHDIIIDGKTGVLVEQKNTEQLADGIIALLDSPELRHSLGREGRRYVLNRYDWEITAGKYDTVFRQLSAKQQDRLPLRKGT